MMKASFTLFFYLYVPVALAKDTDANQARRRLSGSSRSSNDAPITPPLGKCAGDCDTHLDCAGALVCLERSNKNKRDPVPGCPAVVSGTTDICVDPAELLLAANKDKYYYIHNEDCAYNVYLPLEKCEGDCDVDADCRGTLKCYQRNKKNSNVNIPGCSGSFFDSNIDYCYSAADIPSNVAVYIANDGMPADFFPLAKCQGDCDKNSDCAGNLICYQRDSDNKDLPIPGCGTAIPDNEIDFCINPAENNPAGLAECVGDCDFDADCKGGVNFICMERDRYLNSHGEVFGCTGTPESPEFDYCIDRRKIPANRLYYRGNEKDRPQVFPLGKCQGDCDKDSDCAGTLKCFQRDGTTSTVPGCVGPRDPNMDYCV